MLYYQNQKHVHLSASAVMLGKFDGIHIGHQKLVEVLMQEKRPEDQSVMFTFDLNGFRELAVITEEERRSKAEALGIDVMVVWPFDDDTKHMDPLSFIREILVGQLNASLVVVGDDYRFGSNRSGDVETLRQYSDEFGYKVVSVSKVQWQGEEVSSTRIRQAILVGDLPSASAMLGEDYAFSGTIVHGRHIGHTIGIPTINLPVPEKRLLPPFGVYASVTKIHGQKIMGISNLGVKPSVGAREHPGLETHLFDYDHDLYGVPVETVLIQFIRPEQKFDSLETLKKQIQQDAVSAKKLLEVTPSQGPDR